MLTNPKHDNVIDKEQNRKNEETANDHKHKSQKLSVLADLYNNKNPNKKKIGLA